jgi:hypothetical protein
MKEKEKSVMSNYDEVSKRAYELWEKAGKPEGQETQHWLEAENEIMHRQNSNSKSSQKRDLQPVNDRGGRFGN